MPKQLSKELRYNLDRLANIQGLRLATGKSQNARVRKEYPISDEEIKMFLNAIATHQWSQKRVVDDFAKSLGRSKTWVARRLVMMQAQGKIERIADGMTGGRTRYIYAICGDKIE
jgi:predicted transcriptional regulator